MAAKGMRKVEVRLYYSSQYVAVYAYPEESKDDVLARYYKAQERAQARLNRQKQPAQQ